MQLTTALVTPLAGASDSPSRRFAPDAFAANRERRWATGDVMKFRVFFNCQSTGESLSDDSASNVSVPGICDIARRVMREEGDFLGLIDDRDRVLQFRMQDHRTVWMETPVPSERASYGRSVLLLDLLDVLRGLPGAFEFGQLGQLDRQEW